MVLWIILLIFISLEIIVACAIIFNWDTKYLYNKYIKYRKDLKLIKQCVKKLTLEHMTIYKHRTNASYNFPNHQINLPYSFEQVLGKDWMNYLSKRMKQRLGFVNKELTYFFIILHEYAHSIMPISPSTDYEYANSLTNKVEAWDAYRNIPCEKSCDDWALWYIEKHYDFLCPEIIK